MQSLDGANVPTVTLGVASNTFVGTITVRAGTLTIGDSTTGLGSVSGTGAIALQGGTLAVDDTGGGRHGQSSQRRGGDGTGDFHHRRYLELYRQWAAPSRRKPWALLRWARAKTPSS
ncbi:MAG: hypothetical protein WDN28_29175 [Chthoniobacter sp.]